MLTDQETVPVICDVRVTFTVPADQLQQRTGPFNPRWELVGGADGVIIKGLARAIRNHVTYGPATVAEVNVNLPDHFVYGGELKMLVDADDAEDECTGCDGPVHWDPDAKGWRHDEQTDLFDCPLGLVAEVADEAQHHVATCPACGTQGQFIEFHEGRYEVETDGHIVMTDGIPVLHISGNRNGSEGDDEPGYVCSSCHARIDMPDNMDRDY